MLERKFGKTTKTIRLEIPIEDWKAFKEKITTMDIRKPVTNDKVKPKEAVGYLIRNFNQKDSAAEPELFTKLLEDTKAFRNPFTEEKI